MILVVCSASGALIALAGFVFTVWNSNRNYRLAMEANELRRLELRSQELEAGRS